MSPKGWYSRGYLPHFDSPETVQFVTFRLGDSLPTAVAQALAALPDNLLQTDQKLDAGLGACWLGRPDIAELEQSGEGRPGVQTCRMAVELRAAESMSRPAAGGPEENYAGSRVAWLTASSQPSLPVTYTHTQRKS